MTDEQPRDGDGRPKRFNNLTTWLGGATAVIVALGGLAGAARDLWPSSAQTTSDNAVSPDDASQTATDNAAAPDDASQTPATPATDQDQRITSYTTGDGGTLELVDGMWAWTAKDGTVYHYKQISDDGTTTVALLPADGQDQKDVYLRWPNAGGQAFQSFDNQDTWTQPIQVQPAS